LPLKAASGFGGVPRGRSRRGVAPHLPWADHRHGLDPAAIDDLIDALAILAELVEAEAVADSALSDRNDLPVLGTLLAAQRLGSAQTLISGDKALLALGERYPIRSPSEF
jgi:hypothetical protein